MNISTVSESAVLIRFADQVTPKTADIVAQCVLDIRQEFGISIIDIVPSYTTVLVTFDILKWKLSDFMARLHLCIEIGDGIKNTHGNETQGNENKIIELPVCYDKEFSLDADAISGFTGISFEEVVTIHSTLEYRVYAIGFAPGFAYLGNTDPRIHIPRRSTPRLKIPAGSLAIADQQTAIYPKESPGGWHVLGRTPIDLIDFNRKNLTVFEMGAKVIFKPISLQEYRDISHSNAADGSHLEEGCKL